MTVRPRVAGALGAILATALFGTSWSSAPAGAAVAFASALGPARGAWGVDPGAMDPAVRPGDDFFRYANGRWFDSAEFKPDEVYIGARPGVSALRKTRVRAIIEDVSHHPGAPGSLAHAVGALYASYLDTARLDRLGLKPLARDLAQIRAIRTRADLVAAFARAPSEGGGSPIQASVFYDFHAPGWMRLTLTPGGLGLDSREAYLAQGAVAARIRAAYVAYLETTLRQLGARDPAAGARAILALEIRLAQAQWPASETSNWLKTSNDQSPAELKAEAPGFDWDAYLHGLGADGQDVLIIRQPSAMGPLARIIAETPLPVWRTWLQVRLVSRNADLLSAPARAASFAFHGKVLQGQQQEAPRWKSGTETVEDYLGQALGRLYVERYFPADRKAQAAAIFDNIQAVMREKILAASWMSETTRAEALKKIDTLKVKIGYPDRWPDFAGLNLSRDDLWGNVKQLRRRAWAERMRNVRAPLDPVAWQTTPQTSGAAANPNLNEITVPAGGLEPPYFDAAADPAVNYGAIGGVLGHELSHMFDELGRQMDATGALRDWWAPEDARHYEAVADKVRAQYDAFEPAPGLHVNGRLTLDENIADISGLGLALAAYHRSLSGKPAPVIGGTTGDQRLFLGWAQMRAGKMRPEMLAQALASDPHAPDYFRVNGVVRNLDAWYEAFGVKPGDRLYLAPDQRAKFW